MSYLGAQNSIALGVQGLIHIDTGGGAGGSADYLLAKSLRFRSSASAYLNRTVSTTGNRQTFTFSFWCKLGALGTTRFLYGASIDLNNEFSIRFFTDNTLGVYNYDSAYNLQIVTTQVFRDPSAWYHIVVAIDTTQATSTNRVKMYVNGAQITAFSLNTYPAQNYNTIVNYSSTPDNRIASLATNLPNYYDGEMAEVNFVDGQALAPTAFGAFSTYNQWLPIRYAGTYGTNGFYLPFTNTTSTSTLVADSSGNANNWTPNNISLTAGSTYDSLTDVPTLTSTTVANYAVLNPLANNSGNPATVTNGNLAIQVSSNNGTYVRPATISVSSGKWYVEAVLNSDNAQQASQIGVIPASQINVATSFTGITPSYSFLVTPSFATYTTSSSATYTQWGARSTGAVNAMICFDVTAGKIWFGVNNVWLGGGDPATGTFPTYSGVAVTDWFFGINVGNIFGSNTCTVNFGQQPFTYTPPTGFLPLNTFNI